MGGRQWEAVADRQADADRDRGSGDRRRADAGAGQLVGLVAQRCGRGAGADRGRGSRDQIALEGCEASKRFDADPFARKIARRQRIHKPDPRIRPVVALDVDRVPAGA